MQKLFAFAIEQLHADAPRDLAGLRATRRTISRFAKALPAEQVIEAALELHRKGHWLVALELVGHHPEALRSLTLAQVEAFGSRLSDWGSTDAFGSLLAGPAWLVGAIGDQDVTGWADSANRWWRRTALVATTVLNTKSRGGSGDADRTLMICRLLADDRDDMVVKALSWALRTLVQWDPGAVRAFLDDHEPRLAARVKREVDNKLRTNRKAGGPSPS